MRRRPNWPIAAVSVAERSGNRGAIAMANYMRGITYHHSGEYWRPKAVSNCHCIVTMKPRDSLLSSDLATTVRSMLWAYLANLVWLRGSPDHARRLSRMSIAEARQLDHAVPLCVALDLGELQHVPDKSG